MRRSPGAVQQGRRSAVLARTVLDSLPPERRASVVLCLQQGYSYADAEEILGLSPREVRTQLYEARLLFRQLSEARATAGDAAGQRVWEEAR